MSIHEYDLVALTENLSAHHSDTLAPLLLRRGQVGTVLMSFNDEAFLIDFADNEGQTYAMETVPLTKLMVLFHEPLMAAA